ncbi:hypothetical protein DIPPA_26621 [Diplonema papillatum]|nr:hypothetical protein DIPPA_26621 [Diplonema papillatum]
MEDGIRLPLELSPQKSPLFPSTEAHAIAHAPARTKVSDEVLEVAKGHLGEAADTAHKSILLQVSARLESEQLPATLHVLLRIRHVIGLLVCEAVPAKEHLRLMVHVVGMLPLVASHLCTKGCYHAGAKYEAQTFKRAHEGSRDIPVSDTITAIATVDTELAKTCKASIDQKREIVAKEKERAKSAKAAMPGSSRSDNRFTPYQGNKPHPHKDTRGMKGAKPHPVSKGSGPPR